MTTPKFEYNQSIPNVNDDLATSQGGFLANFQQLYDAFAKNHVPFDGGATAGNHTFIELLNNPTGFETSAGEISLNATPVENQAGQLFVRTQGNKQDIQYTNYQIYDQGAIQNGQFGYFTTLPGGLIVYFGAVDPGTTKSKIDLNPFITKQILSVNLCAYITPTITPDFNVLTIENGIVKTIIFNQFATNIIYYYLIVGKT